MIRRLVLYGICLLGFSCGNKLLEEPDNLISKGEMVDILYDIALLDAIDNSHPHVLQRNEIKVMDFVYRKYGIDSTRFVESDRYYASVPALYEEIYTTVEERLNSKRDSVSTVMQENGGAKGDSLDLSDDYE
jgi:hypothetical protein